MAIYKTKMFKNSAKKIRLSDFELFNAAMDVFAGRYEADLGGGVIKKRLPRQGKGKSGGIRTVIFYKQGRHLFFADAWLKSHLKSKSTKEIEDDLLESYKDIAKALLQADDAQINMMLKANLLMEVNCE
ncbi:TPA: type II toxin-antitoxin system RelE/ParE family toxin [Providencia rettgeri]|uniref:type II toxin-antitoxin system RelE/ParE family toxin n=1 Tax=Providencia sp. PROV141 TaxID=2949851 RepID=UPI001B9B55B3|nr:type II toxin-antitoxin system RelE/ParE family toxin [Providencia sp. PROV141]EMB5787064.1 type II toxin-antitoxin system RelE/ParE family toxin [Providencia rettgeri]HBC7431672.1 type II toxin-antitoxin system RelE/ParE family toxin [Providencia rettgeri]